MAFKKKPIEKLFYSVSETAELLREDKATIKYWEREFSRHIHPRFSKGGTRAYSVKDVEMLRLIKRLRSEGLSIDGIRHKLSTNTDSLALKENTLMRLEACLIKLKNIEVQLRSS